MRTESYPSDQGRRRGNPRGFPWDNTTPWLEEHGALFKFDDVGVRHFDTFADSERWFKAEHGSCTVCEGTGFETYERGGYRYARRCERLPALKRGSFTPARRGGFESARDVSLPYREPGDDD